MKGIYSWFLDFTSRVGASMSDSEEIQLQKQILVMVSIFICIAGAVWGSMYVYLELYLPAVFPYLYSFLVGLSVIIFHRIKVFRFLFLSEMVLIFSLPFLLQLSLGGLQASGMVMVWALLAPIGSLMFQEAKATTRWFLAFLLLIILNVYFEPVIKENGPYISETIKGVFFDMNITAVGSISFFVLLYLINERAKQKEKISQLLKVTRKNQRDILVKNKILENLNTKINIQKEELDKKAEDLDSLNQLKDKLFSIISHDLRSPLNSLKSMLMLAENELMTEEDFKKLLPGLAKKMDYTIGLLENLLQWVKSQMKGFKMQPEFIDIKQTGDKKLKLYENQAANKNITLSNKIPEGTQVWADKNAIQLVLRNLISNAIKFCLKDRAVWLEAKNEGSFTQIIVVDTGIGIKPENIDKLFSNETFSTNGTLNEKGTGLGLKLCKDFIEKNGGTITVETEFEMGSRFIISLPNVKNGISSINP